MVQSPEEIACSVLTPVVLSVAQDLKIVRVIAEPGADWTGEPVVRVLVVLDESTKDESMDGEGPRRIIDKIEELLTDVGVGPRPIVSFCLEGEEGLSDYDDDEVDELHP